MAVVKRPLKNKVGGRTVYRYQVKWLHMGDGEGQSVTLDSASDAKELNLALKESGWAYRDTDPEVKYLTLIGLDLLPRSVLESEEARANLTVRQAIEEWINRPGLSRGSISAYTKAANRVCVLNDILVSELTKKQVNDALRSEEKKGAAPNYLLTMRIVLNGALTDVGRPGMCGDTNYTGGRKVVPYYLRPAQETALIEAARARGGDRLAAAVQLTLACGTRWGETYGLRARYIDTEDRLLHLEEGINNGDKLGDGWHPHQLKTKASRRKVPIPPEVCEALAPLLVGVDSNDPVFFPKGDHNRLLGRKGAMFWSHRTFHYNWKRICKAAVGVPDDLRYHDLRHTCAKRWLEAGVPIGIVSRMLGHSKIDVTHAEYGGFDKHSLDLMRNILAASDVEEGRTLRAVV